MLIVYVRDASVMTTVRLEYPPEPPPYPGLKNPSPLDPAPPFP